MPTCAVAICRNVSGRGDSALRFHRFPDDPDIFIQCVLTCKGQKRIKVSKQCSVPHLYLPNKIENASRDSEQRLYSRTMESEANLSAKLKTVEHEIMLLKIKVFELKYEIKWRRESENRLKKENKMLKQQLLQIKFLHYDVRN
ncbi:hypothetical protein PR048_013166 [Dryococelus australis]|uniref:THAP-type domain-containing protein n=1 Tax=Dryococelus australis TaxID=614101 RepID=A0ABQ9HRC1_9NEOP|nr:hypothetical protein PR048_013166 [Dryococelus australis]